MLLPLLRPRRHHQRPQRLLQDLRVEAQADDPHEHPRTETVHHTLDQQTGAEAAGQVMAAAVVEAMIRLMVIPTVVTATALVMPVAAAMRTRPATRSEIALARRARRRRTRLSSTPLPGTRTSAAPGYLA